MRYVLGVAVILTGLMLGVLLSLLVSESYPAVPAVKLFAGGIPSFLGGFFGAGIILDAMQERRRR